MAQMVAKFPPRSVDNHSFGIPDFEPLLNSHQQDHARCLHSSIEHEQAGSTEQGCEDDGLE
jgi:hypothetical protein